MIFALVDDEVVVDDVVVDQRGDEAEVIGVDKNAGVSVFVRREKK